MNLLRTFKAASDRARKRLDVQVKTLIKNSSWLISDSSVRAVLAVLRSIVIARGLGASLYGTYIIIAEFVATVQSIFDTTMGTTVIKFGADYRSENRIDKLVALVKLSGMVGMGSSLLTIVSISVVAFAAYDVFLDVPGLELFLILYAVAAAFDPLAYIAGSLLRLYDKFRLNAMLNMGLAVVELICITLILLFFPKNIVLFFIVVIIAKYLTGTIICFAALYELWGTIKHHLRAGIHLLRAHKREITGFVLQNGGSRTIQVIIRRADVLLLGATTSAADVAIYQVGKKLANMLLRFSDPMFKAIYPQVASLIAAFRFREVRSLLSKVSLGLSIPGLVIVIAAVFLGEWAIVLLYGQDFAAANWILLIFLGVSVPTFVFFWGLPVVLSLGKTNMRLIFNLIALIIGAPLAAVLTPTYGSIGLAIAVLVAQSIIVYGYVFVSYRGVKPISPVH